MRDRCSEKEVGPGGLWPESKAPWGFIMGPLGQMNAKFQYRYYITKQM